MRPLRRKPKTLTTEPTLHLPSGGGAGSGMAVAGRRPPRAPQGLPSGTSAPGLTDDSGDVVDTTAPGPTIDDAARERARLIANRLALTRPRQHLRPRRSPSGELVTRRWTGAGDDIDLEATLEILASTPHPADDDILVRDRLRTRRNLVLVVDISGSRRGEQVRTAAATVGALIGELGRDDIAVVAFWSDASLLVQMGQKTHPDAIIEQLLTIPTQGLTNVAFALEVAGQQLAGIPPADARVLLLSDCVHNAGPDPRAVAAGLPRLDVLLDRSEEFDLELASDLASVGHGRCRTVDSYRDVAPALMSIFG